jgi:5'-nucleotidase / UDP-sugar diphosphatase
MGIKEFCGLENEIDTNRRVFAVDWEFSEIEADTLPDRREDLQKHPFLLKIFHINDLHCNIYSFSEDYSTIPVFSKIVNEVEKERKISKNQPGTGVLFLSAGDDSTGSAMDHITGYDGENFKSHPVYSAFSLAGLDVTVLGNHDFDTGLATLKKSIMLDTNFPVLSANLEHDGELDGLVFPGAVVIIKGVRIGIIGLTTPGQIRSRKGSSFSITNPLKKVEKFYSLIAPYCDSVVVLSHLGYKVGSTFATVKIMGDKELASSLRDQKIDLIIGGHTHDFLNINGLEMKNIVNDIPILQAGFNGLFYGKTILKISDKNSLSHTSVLPSGNLKSNKEFDLLYKNTNAGKSIESLVTPLGTSDLVKINMDRRYDIFKDSYENPMANFITDSLSFEIRKSGQAIDFTIIDSTSMIKFFDPSRKFVNITDIYRLMPYADTITIAKVNGKDLEELIKENVFRIDKNDKPHIERGFVHFGKEIRYKIDSKGNRVLDFTFNGALIESCSNKIFTIAMPNYIQGLSRSWEKLETAAGRDIKGFRDIQKKDSGMYVRNELLKYIKNNGISKESGFLLDGRLEII